MDSDIDSLFQIHNDAVLQREDWYLSKHSKAEVVEAGRDTSKSQRMNDAELCSYLKESASLIEEEVQFRAIFIPDDPKTSDKLQLTYAAFQLLHRRFRILSRFAGMIRNQMQPSRKFDYDQKNREIVRLQYVYSHILRTLGPAENPKDPTKRVLDWQRVIYWTSREMFTGVTTVIVLRCPPDTQETFVKAIRENVGQRRLFLRHPMLVHAFFAEDLAVKSIEFSREFAEPIYALEADLGRSAAEYTQRAQRFMRMARQMGNVMIDYDIYSASLKLLREMSQLIRQSASPVHVTKDEWQAIHAEFDGDVFERVQADFELLQRYGKLYEQRAMIGNNECIALVNQREIEISKSMSAESTIIARNAHRDSQSLRIIQYLGLVFLPLSLCASVFGMSFFSTGLDGNNHPVFAVAHSWWWFLALAVPFTIAVLLAAWYSTQWTHTQDEARRKSDLTDLERMISQEGNPSTQWKMDEKIS